MNLAAHAPNVAVPLQIRLAARHWAAKIPRIGERKRLSVQKRAAGKGSRPPLRERSYPLRRAHQELLDEPCGNKPRGWSRSKIGSQELRDIPVFNGLDYLDPLHTGIQGMVMLADSPSLGQ